MPSPGAATEDGSEVRGQMDSHARARGVDDRDEQGSRDPRPAILDVTAIPLPCSEQLRDQVRWYSIS